MIHYKCTSCGAKLETEDALAGRPENCPACGSPNSVPGPKPKRPAKRGAAIFLASGVALLAAAALVIAMVIPQGPAAPMARAQASTQPAATAPVPQREPTPPAPDVAAMPQKPTLPIETVPEAGRKALDRLSRLEAKTEMGLVLSEYRKELGEAWADIKPFMDSQEARSCPGFRVRLLNAVQQYQMAQETWEMKIKGPNYDNRLDALMQVQWSRSSISILEARAIATGQPQADEAKIAELRGVADRFHKTTGTGE